MSKSEESKSKIDKEFYIESMTCRICYSDLDQETRNNSFSCLSCGFSICKTCKDSLKDKTCPECNQK